MPEHDAFETRFRRAYRRYVEEAPADVDAAAVARAAATQRRFAGFRWPAVGGPARVLMWVGLLALLLAALAAGTLLTGSEGPVSVAADISGTSACDTTDAGAWSGPMVLGVPGTRLSNMVMDCTSEMSDARLSGPTETKVDCVYSDEDGLLVSECWGTTTVRNEEGVWAGVFSGTTRVGTGDVMETVWLGSGDYLGLRFVGTLATADDPYVISGRVEAVGSSD